MTDTPRGLKPHGFSGSAQPCGSHWLLKAVPRPVGQLTPSPGERSAQLTLAQAERTLSKMCYCFYPWNGLPRNRPKEY
jgi:hypothetical protein